VINTKIFIQAYWNTETATLKTNLKPEEQIEKKGKLTVCDIVIDGKVVGSVCWNGKHLFIRRDIAETFGEQEGVPPTYAPL